MPPCAFEPLNTIPLDSRLAETELAGDCPSGRSPATTSALRRTMHPPGQGGWGPARRYRSSTRGYGGRVDVVSCSLQPIQFSTSTLRCVRIPFREPLHGGYPRRFSELPSATLPRSSLRRSQGRADHRTSAPRLPWPAPRTRWRCGWAAFPTMAGWLAIQGPAARLAASQHPQRASSSRCEARYLAKNAPFHRAGRPRVPRAATRTPSRKQRTTLLLREAQGAFHR